MTAVGFPGLGRGIFCERVAELCGVVDVRGHPGVPVGGVVGPGFPNFVNVVYFLVGNFLVVLAFGALGVFGGRGFVGCRSRKPIRHTLIPNIFHLVRVEPGYGAVLRLQRKSDK